MGIKEIIATILEIIAEVAPDEDLTGLNPVIPLQDQVDFDSVVFLAAMMEVQERFGIEVPEEDYVELTTLNRCAAYLEARCNRLHQAGTTGCPAVPSVGIEMRSRQS